jgi:hypothetical protein
MATTRQNYGTFVPVEAVDWGKAIGGLYNTIDKIGLDREQQRQDLDKIMTDSISAINNSELLKTQSLQDYVLAGAENGRNVINDANKRLKSGMIKPAEYRAIINNVNSYWSNMSNSMKNFDAVNQELLTRQQPGEDGSAPAGSEFEEFLLQKHASLSDLRNSNYMFSPDSGEGYMVKIDPVTGQTKKVMNSLSIADKSNIMDQRYDFDKEIITFTRGMKNAYTMEDGTVTIKDPMKNPAVANSVAALITGMTNNPRMTAQALARYGGYQFYEDDEDMNQIITEAINDEAQSRRILGEPALTQSEIENIQKNVSDRLIKVSIDLNNRYQPQISPEQQKDAEVILEDLIVAQFPVSRTEDEPPRGRSGGRKVGSDTEVKVNASTQDFSDKFVLAMSKGNSSEAEMNKTLKARGLQVDWNGKGWDVYKYNEGKKNVDKYGTETSRGGYEKTQYVNLPWNAEDFWKVLGLKENEWAAAVQRSRSKK